MFNKIYENIKKFIKENYKTLLLYLILLIICTYRLPFYIYTGGGTIDLENRIDLKGNEKGSYNLAYVKQIYATIPTYLLSFVMNKWDVVKVSDLQIDNEEDVKDIDNREKLYLEEANNHAILNAYKLAGKTINMKESSYKVIYVNKDSDTNIIVGDKLLSVNGVKITNNLEYKKYLQTLEVGTRL